LGRHLREKIPERLNATRRPAEAYHQKVSIAFRFRGCRVEGIFIESLTHNSKPSTAVRLTAALIAMSWISA
jgi:hypothetical protein